jgi:hypothetical protein
LEYLGFSLFSLVDVFIIMLCAFGIYQKSRVAATAMFIYFVGCKMLQSYDGNISAVGGGLGVVFLLIYYRAMKSTYTYKRLTNTVPSTPLIPVKDHVL